MTSDVIVTVLVDRVGLARVVVRVVVVVRRVLVFDVVVVVAGRRCLWRVWCLLLLLRLWLWRVVEGQRDLAVQLRKVDADPELGRICENGRMGGKGLGVCRNMTVSVCV